MSHSPRPPSLAPSRKSIFREEFNSDLTLPYPNLGLPAAGEPINNDTDDANMATSPTPRELRRLASDHNFVFGATDPAPRRLGFLSFLKNHLSLAVALIIGVISVVVAIVYTVVTSRQLLHCPTWANDCRSVDLWTAENLGVIQGIITTVYLIGLSALAYISLSLCQAALWPLLHTQPFTIRGLEGFLALTHGNVMSLPDAAMSLRSVSAGIIFIICLLSTALPLAGPPLVGSAYTPRLESVAIASNITSLPSSVMERPFTQANPLSSAHVPALSAYHNYASDPLSEPLPDFRNWLFDRSTLSSRGSFTAKAINLDTVISCQGRRLQQLQKDGLSWNAFKTTTNLSSTHHKPSGQVWFQPQPHLTVFLDDVKFPSNNSINTTVIFAALNGTIAGGTTTNLTLGTIDTVSAIACEILTTATDGILTVGPDPPHYDTDNANIPILSSLSHLPNLTSTLLWLTASPILAGVSLEGSQPLFSNNTLTHLPTSDLSGTNTWTIPGLENFISMSIGATATSLFSHSASSTKQQQELISNLETNKLSTDRAYLLLILPLLYLFLITITALWNMVMHKKHQIPVMRTMNLSELLKSSQTGWMRDKTGADAAKSYLPSDLGGLGVRFGVVEGEVGFGPAQEEEDGTAVAGFVVGRDDKGKAREPLGDGSGSRVGSRVHTGNSSVSWQESYHSGREVGRERSYRMERGEWPRQSDL
ncbi:hypothetical protein QBC40DRAFT_268268 [Triangularia verruculosa]|uniref:Uncharacterized protein n=1 Tax=Triangularia verruculosa TaxID=2587418 RepID=A0AAN6XBR9_9PEZI|nr:hypothetical protein QBC40DRAFT_268268 [Triangularia verruculosa]